MPLKISPVPISNAKQMKYYWGYCLKQNNCKSLEEMRNASQAPLNHLCNNHNYCNSEWCGQKKALEQGKIFRNDNDSKSYLDLNNDVDRQVYDDILHIVKQFSTDKMLIESMHKGNTQANESLNNILSYFAPKNINYARSSSFLYRVSINGGIQIDGYFQSFLNVFYELGISLRGCKRKQKFVKDEKMMEEIFQDRTREETGMCW